MGFRNLQEKSEKDRFFFSYLGENLRMTHHVHMREMVAIIHKSKRDRAMLYFRAKGQLILKGNFGVFNSSEKELEIFIFAPAYWGGIFLFGF